MNAPAVCRHCRAPLEPAQAYCTRCGAATRIAQIGEDPLRDTLEAAFGGELIIEHEIGRGAMGAVYSAFDPALQRRVAVKALLPEIESQTDVAERFLREARIAASLQHPDIVSVYSVRSTEGLRAIVMQFVEGRSLDRVLTETSQLPLPTVAKILADVSAALQHAHDRRVIHRDVKPANVLLDTGGRAIVSDFGIARVFGATRITAEGLVMGTLPYISPEAAVGGETSPASDQYSLGVMAFQMLVGTRPFRGTAQQLLHAHAHVAPPSIANARPDLPQSVVATVHRMLEKNPAARWPTLHEVDRIFRLLVADADAVTRQMAQLSRVGVAEGTVIQTAIPRRSDAAADARVVPPTAAAPRPSATQLIPPTVSVAHEAPSPPAFSPRSRVRSLAAAGVVTAVAVAAIAFQVTNRHGSDDAPSATTPAAAPAATQPTPAPGVAKADGGAPRPAAGANLPVPSGRPASERTLSTDSSTRGAVAATHADSAAPVTTAPRRDSTLAERNAGTADPPPTKAPAERPPAAPRTPASTADARRLGNEFVTYINKRQWRELEALPGTGGDAAARAALIRAVRGTSDVAAGFDRVPSSPDMIDGGFESECMVQLDVTSGGRTQTTTYMVVFRAVHDGAAWHLAGWRVTGAP